MSALPCTAFPHSARTQRGFTLVELMVTVGIALFLLYGLVTIVETVRRTSLDQQSLAQLQDQQRFAMTVLTDVIQAGGYFPDPTTWTPATSLPAAANTAGAPTPSAHCNCPVAEILKELV